MYIFTKEICHKCRISIKKKQARLIVTRFVGVLIYVNSVQRGQAEVYVVLEKAQIGVRIRESYALDIDRVADYHESMGLLDIAISVPPQYGVVNFYASRMLFTSDCSCDTLFLQSV